MKAYSSPFQANHPFATSWISGAALSLLLSLTQSTWARVVEIQDDASPRIDSSQLIPEPPVHSQASPQPAARLDALRKQSQSNNRATSRNASWLLGLLFLHGAGVTQDAQQARQWFQRAQELGHPWASAGLAWCEIEGCGQPPNPAQARRWLSQLQTTQPARAQYLRWWKIQQESPLRTGPSQPSSSLPGQTLLQQAARAGDAQALNALGLQAVTASRWNEAQTAFTAAAQRSPAASRNLQRLEWQAPLLSSKQPTTANTAGQRQWQQAQRYHKGQGVPVNYTEALRLYQAAAAQGNAQAKQMLAVIYSRPLPGGQVNPAWMQQLAHTDQTLPKGESLSPQLPSDVQLYAQDPTPLYDLLPSSWRDIRIP